MLRLRLLLGLCALCMVLNGCVISPRRDTVGGGGGGGGGGFGRIYVSDSVNNSIIRFDNALTVTGNATPGTTISGSSTTLSSPQYLFLDVGNNRLFVANQGGSNILVFDSMSTQAGNAAPNRAIGGPATQLISPVDVALDRVKDLLYVADSSTTNIQVFANGSTANGNATPLHTLAIGFPAAALFIDSANNRLFVADNTIANAVHVFDAASTLNGAVTANRTVTGGTTQLNQPKGLQVDNAGRLIVSNALGSSITFYASAATANGDITPAATIAGSNTGLSNPTQLTLNNATTTGDLYVVDGGAASVLIFANIGGANGNVVVSRNINGSNTGLGGAGSLAIKGIALDTTR